MMTPRGAVALRSDPVKTCLACEGVTDTQAQRCGNCSALLLPTDALHFPARRGEVDASNPLLGAVIDGKYRLQSVLGRGGLGTVFRAQHVGSLVTVALKLLHPRFAQRPEYRRALLPEARRAATVVHEHCARLLDVGEGNEGIHYLAMELVEGQTLEEVLRDGPLQPAHALEVLTQVAAALAAVHEVGLVHCDLSPRNVMVAARGGRLEAKVLDFGIARSVDLADRGGQKGELRGFANPAFSAPELLAGADVDARADIYSLGTLAWLLLTGTMPVEESDRDRAIEAVRAGRLLPWPGAPGVPRPLVRLVRRCLSLDRAQRPASIRDVHQRLEALRSRRGRKLRRVAMFTGFAAAALALVASDVGRAMFLRPKTGSALLIAEGPLARDAAVQHLRREQLAAVEFDWGGIQPTRLVAELARAGKSLARVPLEPEIDRVAGTLVLSERQPSWRGLLQQLARASAAGPVDLAFLVPGAAALGAGRIRFDDEAPTLGARLRAAGGSLRADTALELEVGDDVGVAAVEGVIRVDGRPVCTVALPTATGAVPLGRLVADRVPGVAARGRGAVLLRATDRAGNVRELPPLGFDRLDVAVPEVLRVGGPAGQRSLTRSGDRLRFRVELSAGEADLELWVRHGEQERSLPLSLEATDAVLTQTFDLDVAGLLEGVGAFELRLAVRDAVGNEAERRFPVRVVDRSPEVLLQPVRGPDRPPAALRGAELVVGPAGGAFAARIASDYRVARARVERDGRQLTSRGAAVALTTDGAEITIAALEPGAYTLRVELEERVDDQLEPVLRQLPLRVLPERVTVQVPTTSGRFVPELVGAGVLARSSSDATPQIAQGVGWRWPTDLRPYIRGVCFRGGQPIAPVRAQEGPLLPTVPLQPGRTTLELALEDTLGRAVLLADERGGALPVAAGRATVASFWWSDAVPAVVGERLLVERDRPLRFRVRMGLPLQPRDRDRLRLGLGSGEWPAVDVESSADASELVFEVPFSAWSVAAQLADLDRQQFARGLEAEVVAYLLAPSGRSDLTLPLQTTRSTLAPLRLGDVAGLPAGLQDLRLLPVLAPEGPFVEPIPERSPPRATFRPQPVNPVRNMPDVLLQERELCVGEARALVAALRDLGDRASRADLVHAGDPLGLARLEPQHLLPSGAADLAPEQSLAGVDFFQAWALTRTLGLVVGGDPALFRLPLGCELELAAFSGADLGACSGVAGHGGAVRAAAFEPGSGGAIGSSEQRCRTFGDVVPTTYGRAFVGLDFGLREWVNDLPHTADAALLLREWTGDHAAHLARVSVVASGAAASEQDTFGLQQRIGVVRGLAFGETSGLIGLAAEPLRLRADEALPSFVPGVLRTEQLRRDGRALLGAGRDPRLSGIGFRVAGDADALAQLWGSR